MRPQAFVLLVAGTALGGSITETVEGLGGVAVVCDGGELYLELDYETFANLAAPLTATVAVPAGECAPFDHVYFSFEPVGHPPWDGRGNGYGAPHADVHFFIVSEAFRDEHMRECEVAPGAANCDASVAANTPFLAAPPAALTTGFFDSAAFGGNAVPNHGMHLIPESDAAAGGPAECRTSAQDGAADPAWLDCLYQQLGVLGVTEDPPKFVDRGCACGPWADGASPILLTFDGRVVGYEIMPSQAHAARLGVDLPNPYVAPYPRQDEREPAVDAGHYPTHIRSFRAADKIHFGLTLAASDTAADAEPESDGAAPRAAAVAAVAAAAAAALL